jgi:hypothetical protein
MEPYSRNRPIAAFAMVVSLQLTAGIAWCQTATDAGDSSNSVVSSVTDYFRRSVSFTGETRTRWEGGIGSNFTTTAASSYVLQRTRLGLKFKPTSWMHLFVETQDSRAMFYKVSPTNAVSDPFDWRQGWVEIGASEGNGLRLRVGRSDIVLGSGRLLSSGDWSNVTKTFNLARGTITRDGFKMDLFGGQVVLANTAHMSNGKPGERFYGSYVTLSKIISGISFEPYVLMKTAVNVKSKDDLCGRPPDRQGARIARLQRGSR